MVRGLLFDKDGTILGNGGGQSISTDWNVVGVADFNGDGVDEIGVFRAGKWIIDSNGNHHVDAQDKVFELGGAGDKPVVGDWNDDGIDTPGIVRGGEGATKLIEIEITGAASDHSAKTVACSIANSPLVKTAMAAGDAAGGDRKSVV